MTPRVPLWLWLPNLCLLVLFPISWISPLLRAGLLPLFGLSEISILSGIQSLWDTDLALAILVALLALVAPMLKTLALAAVHFGVAGPRTAQVTAPLAKLAMADVFLIALYVVVSKGVGVGRVETAWGLWLFTGCVLMSIWVSYMSQTQSKRTAP